MMLLHHLSICTDFRLWHFVFRYCHVASEVYELVGTCSNNKSTMEPRLSCMSYEARSELRQLLQRKKTTIQYIPAILWIDFSNTLPQLRETSICQYHQIVLLAKYHRLIHIPDTIYSFPELDRVFRQSFIEVFPYVTIEVRTCWKL